MCEMRLLVTERRTTDEKGCVLRLEKRNYIHKNGENNGKNRAGKVKGNGSGRMKTMKVLKGKGKDVTFTLLNKLKS